MRKNIFLGILLRMKKILLTLSITVFCLSNVAQAEMTPEELKEIAAQSASITATNSYADMIKACKSSSAIEHTKSYNESLPYQIDTIDAFNAGETAFKGNQWDIAEKEFKKTIKYSVEAINHCKESQQLKLSKDNYDSALTENIVMRIGNGLKSGNETRLKNMFRGELLKTINRVLGAFAIFFIVLIGAKYVMALGNEEKMSSYKLQFVWLLFGLTLISLAEFIGFELLDPSGGNDILSAKTEATLSKKIHDIVRFFEYIAGGLMLMNAVLTGYHLVMRGDQEEAISHEKKFLQSLLMGSAMILMAEIIVRLLSFNDSAQKTTEMFVTEVAGIVNFTLSFVAILSMAMLVLSSLYFVISFGNEDQTTRAKRMIKTSITGVIIASASYVLVRFIIL